MQQSTAIIGNQCTAQELYEEQHAQAKSYRTRNWFLVSYLSFEQITDYCKMGHISHYAIIKHDKDEGKEPHHHVIVVFKNARTFGALKRDFSARNAFGNTLFEPSMSLQSSYEYLTHKNHADKYQYSDKDIVCDNGDWWRSISRGEQPNTAFEIVSDILDGKNPVYMLKKYGQNYLINAHKYYEFANAVGTTSEVEYDFIQAERENRRNWANRDGYESFHGVHIPDEIVYYDENGMAFEPCYEIA